MKNLTLILALVSLTLSCAKVREENTPGDGNQDRIEKTYLTGISAEKSSDVRQFSDFKNRFNPISKAANGKLWLHKVTVTNVSSLGGPVFIGYQSDVKAGYFKFNKDSLEFMSVVNSNRVSDGKLDDVVYIWDVDHSEYRYRESDGRPTNSLEEDSYVPWSNKSFFKIDWAKSAKTLWSVEGLGGCWKIINSYTIPESRKYEEDYVEFTKKHTYENTCGYSSYRQAYRGIKTFQAEYTYSFKLYKNEAKSAEKYKPYVYNGEFDPLIQKYGYFKTVYEEMKDDGRFKANFLMNRWNPNKALHTFYFAPGFPEQFKWIYKTDPLKKDPYGKPVIGVMDQTNKVLADAGVKMRFEIKDAPEGINFGDLRYSFIKFMVEPNGSSPLGYGPSDTNPFTGELIAANSMVWTSSLQYYVQLIDEWIKRGDLDEGSSQSIYTEMDKIMGTTSEDFISEWTETSKDLQPNTYAGHLFKKMLPDFTYGLTYWAPFTAGHTLDENGKVVLPLEETQVFEFKDQERLQAKFGRFLNNAELKMLKSVDVHGHKHVDQIRTPLSDNDTTIYSADFALNGVKGMIVDGKTAQEVIDTILYRVAVHEFGHNMNLRHNFYGSVDKNNFDKGENLSATNAEGVTETRHYPAVSSSVMDYLSLQGEMHTSYDWEAYDKAALTYAYTAGKVDHSKDEYPAGHALAGEKKHFLYCTDEHRGTNALCNTWDLGSTPTEIVMSLIDTYQKSYFTINRRFDRAYWDTSSYDSRIFGTMWNIKKFIMLDQSTFTYGNKELGEAFKKHGVSKIQEPKVFEPITRDIKRAIKISVAFYNAVLQQSNVERQYFSEYDGPTGALLRKGIFADKLYATYFLLGDDAFMYNPNVNVSYASYLEYSDDPDVGNAIKKVTENLLTERVDAEPGFINFGRMLYADSATNYYNQNNAALASRFQMTCYPVEKFTKHFGLNPYLYTYKGDVESVTLVADTLNVANLPATADLSNTIFANEFSEIGFALVDGRVYVASKAENEIAFTVINKLKEAYQFGEGDSSDKIGIRKSDVRDTRFLYRAMTGAEDYCI